MSYSLTLPPQMFFLKVIISKKEISRLFLILEELPSFLELTIGSIINLIWKRIRKLQSNCKVKSQIRNLLHSIFISLPTRINRSFIVTDYIT